MLCCFALFVCLILLASFFLPSHLSFKNMYINFKFSVPIGRFQSTSKNARNSFLMIFHSPHTGDCSAVTCLRPVCSNGILVTPPGECCPECMASEHSSHTYSMSQKKVSISVRSVATCFRLERILRSVSFPFQTSRNGRSVPIFTALQASSRCRPISCGFSSSV